MNIYIAGAFASSYMEGQTTNRFLNDNEKNIFNSIENNLESYHYINTKRLVETIRDSGKKIFLDSGAFSAYTVGAEINIQNYCDYIKENEDIIRKDNGVLLASVLDGIGDPLKTYQNQKIMEKQGVTPLPCFHIHEDTRYLEYYIKNYPYITLGGMVGKSKVILLNWLDDIWGKYLIDASGKPKLKVHAFGVTSIDIMERYPWESVDSSTWVQRTIFGGVLTEYGKVITVSKKSPNRHTSGRHIDTLTDIEKQKIINEFELNGFKLNRLQGEDGNLYPCSAYSCLSLDKINNRINKTPIIFKAIKQTLF